MRVAWLVLLNILWVASAWAYLTDTSVHTEPTLPLLATANAIRTDPTFGSTILRLTDSGDSSTNCSTTYSNASLLNSNNTKIAALCTAGYNRFKIWDFNAGTMTRSNGRIQANPPSGFQEYGVQWSHTVYNKFYGVGGKTLYEITIPDGGSTTWTNTAIRDFTGVISGSTITQMSMSANNDVFAFHYTSPPSSGFVAYKRSTNTVLLHVVGGGGSSLDEVEIDKSGRYLVVCCSPSRVYDLQATPITNATITNNDFFHRAMGSGFVISHGSSNNLIKRSLATPNTVTTILSSGWSYSNTQDHYSLTGSDNWMMSCRYSTNGQTVEKVFDQECAEISTTGNGQVRRHVHHRSEVMSNDYASQPKGSVSFDGQFIAFTSNWGNPNGRRDVYIVKLPSSGSGDSTPPATPVNLRVQ